MSFKTQSATDDGVIGVAVLLNILEDYAEEKLQLEYTQRAVLNILDDLDLERIRVEEANTQLHSLNSSMLDFISIASHDLRSPLTSIMGYSVTLDENWDIFSNEIRRDMVATISQQSQNLARLIEDLFTLSSIESGGLKADPTPTRLLDIIDQCVTTGDYESNSMSVSCSSDLVILVDQFHLTRIIDNYLTNAFKYGKPPIRIEATQVGEMVEIRVSDHGLGVPPEFVPKLFNKFARASTSSTKAVKGVGLGLSIVRALAEINGGLTSYEPNVPTGSCFIVCLPLFERSII